MKLDPTKMKDWQIAEAAEESLRPAKDLAKNVPEVTDSLRRLIDDMFDTMYDSNGVLQSIIALLFIKNTLP